VAGPSPSLRTALPPLSRTAAPLPRPKSGAYHAPRIPGPDGTGALDQPDQVGRDPSTIHFSIGTLPTPVSAASWSFGPDRIEKLDLALVAHSGDEASFDAELSRGPNPKPVPSPGHGPAQTVQAPRELRIGGRSATLRTVEGPNGSVQQDLRWSPADGLEMLVEATQISEGELVDLASALEFDQSAHCGSPVQLTALPPGSRLVDCQISLPSDTAAMQPAAWIELTTMPVHVMGGPRNPSEPEPKAGWHDSIEFFVPDLQGCAIRLVPNLANKTARQAETQRVADGIRRADCARLTRGYRNSRTYRSSKGRW
jgi:hypothetical protein